MRVRVRPDLPSLPVVAPERGQSERELANRLCVPPLVVSRITGSVTILTPGGRVEAGLGIKSRRQRLVSVGWVRLRSSAEVGGREVWEYSSLAERTLREYKLKFPSLWSLLERAPESDQLALDDVFPPTREAEGWGVAAVTRPGEVEGEALAGREQRLEALLDFLGKSGAHQAQVGCQPQPANSQPLLSSRSPLDPFLNRLLTLTQCSP